MCMLLSTYAGVAQLAEQLICNQQVAGSNPIASSSILAVLHDMLLLAIPIKATNELP